jgi:SagB-type dehydrogenase family enzyme
LSVLNKKDELAKIFHLNTKNYYKDKKSNEISGYKLFPGRKNVFVKGKIDLKNSLDNKNSLFSALENRQSYQKLGIRYPIDLSDISLLLNYSYGGREGESNFIKTVPSAGGRYSLNLFLVAFNILGLAQGIYYWEPFENYLGLIKKGDFREQLKSAITLVNKEDVEKCSFAISISANLEQTLSKYGNRGYRYICMDVGYVSQNLYLLSSHLGLATRAIGGFYDEIASKVFTNTDCDETMLIHLFGKESITVADQLNLKEEKYFY